ncbi:MAG: DNA-directed RNA polymerase subunit K, partial [archaeon]|nr:DNA-directed RNA polymerase subunit K [archaeon]
NYDDEDVFDEEEGGSYGENENLDDELNEENQQEDQEQGEQGNAMIIEDEDGHNQGPNGPNPVAPEERITTEYLTKYEKARVLGARALQISRGAPVMIPLDPGVWDPFEIANKELRAGKIPFIIRRFLPNNKYEDVKVSSLKLE